MTTKNKLVIVESPAKARTLDKILGQSYTLKATMGHIRDLPKSQLGVDIEEDFTPKYVTLRDKSRIIKELKQAIRDAGTIYLATDPDREGEAIAWHLKEITGNGKKNYRRVVFHEITKEAIERAFKTTRPLDIKLVDAQQARRILDRLVGYKLSPLLWRKVAKGLSAGRVQSVAVRIIVEREREIESFKPQEYWSIQAELAKRTGQGKSFRALLIGLVSGQKLEIKKGLQAEEIKAELEDSDYRVLKIKTKKTSRQPVPPFITSTLQQEAWRKLRFSAKQTMVVAQQLYEGLPIGDEGNSGLITYMRTDSTRVARSAVAETRDLIKEKYGSDYIPAHARSFTRRVKGAQEAHEAIRPTRIWRQPLAVKSYLNNAQYHLYRIIWERMVASQMAAAVFENTITDIEARHTPSKTRYLLRITSQINIFPGFTRLYTEGRDEEKEVVPSTPSLEEREELKLLEIYTKQHFTQPSPRFTEATLIKVLEQFGIGRPSTYAPIISTIQERNYITKINGALKPTELGIIVNDIVVQYFGNIIDISFSAAMEDKLDKIADEGLAWRQVIRDFYKPFNEDLEKAVASIERVKLAPEEVSETCPNCDRKLVIKSGRFGKFLACPGYPECKFTKPYVIKTDIKCPEAGCGGDIIEKRSKKAKIFYGCSNYPDCRFAVFNKPLPQPCPECCNLLTAYRNQARCIKCGYKGKVK
jgi:DNA topoisomerase-1